MLNVRYILVWPYGALKWNVLGSARQYCVTSLRVCLIQHPCFLSLLRNLDGLAHQMAPQDPNYPLRFQEPLLQVAIVRAPQNPEHGVVFKVDPDTERIAVHKVGYVANWLIQRIYITVRFRPLKSPAIRVFVKQLVHANNKENGNNQSSALRALCKGNPPVTGKWPVMRKAFLCYDVIIPFVECKPPPM